MYVELIADFTTICMNVSENPDLFTLVHEYSDITLICIYYEQWRRIFTIILCSLYSYFKQLIA
jgi:hypothetical protein